ncbi:PAS domain S-box protein [Rhodospirillaceae bacterium KN72]|uniref:histidine kinase n=1 Tax=Pacificispira spongiicola TaxID=2729598 RepID=A0A7Y0HIF9_9PROT|nr:CHASE domain-containing protein [Pacificispira spongiicola]NMM46509.1 PAS domain S-box protein [Pacificispira spongiicola]
MFGQESKRFYLLASLLFFLIVASVASASLRRSNEAEDRERVTKLVNEFSQLIADRFMLYQYGLRGARGVIQAGGYRNISRSVFVDYVKSRDMEDEFPGARGIGYIEIVDQDQAAGFVERARRDGFVDFSIRELSPNSEMRFLIKYIYPLKGNEGATGLDIGSETNRRTAAWEAVKTGQPKLTAPITLVQATGEKKQGFLLLLPVYERPDVEPDEREETVVGWTYSPLVVSEVLKNLGPRRDEMAFSISDVGFEGEFFASPGFESGKSIVSRTISVFGREWDVRFHTLPGFSAAYTKHDPAVLFVLILSIGAISIFAAYTFLRVKQRDREIEEENEKLANTIFDAAPQALIAIDASGVIVRSSPYADSLIARERRTLQGMRASRIFTRDTFQQLESILRAPLSKPSEGQPGRRIVSSITRADGTSFMGAISLSTIRLGSKNSLVASVTDVSAEHKAMEILSESQQRWQELANSLPQFVWTCTATGECDFLSHRWLEYTGRTSEEQIGFQWLEQVHPDDRERTIVAWNKAVEAKSSFIVEFRIRDKNGDYRLFYTRAEPILDSDGNVGRWIGSNTDIEDRHRAEERNRELLSEMEARVVQRTGELNSALRDLRNIVDAMPTLISYWDRNLRNRFANKAFEDWIGMATGEVQGKLLSEMMPEERLEIYRPYIEDAFKGNKSVVETELLHKTLGHRNVLLHFLPDTDGDQVFGFYSLVFDVTVLKATEEAQRQARIVAEDATRAKSAFLTSMSHELRTPMNSILGFSDLLRSNHFGVLNKKQSEYVGLIHRSGEHLLKLMDGVLELSKIEAGRVSVSTEPVNVTSAVRSVIASLTPLAERNGVEVSERNITDASGYVLADKTRLMQVLLNLGSNAIKYNKRGGRVEFSFTKGDDGITRITVTDNGRGIPADRQAGAFQPFNRMGAEQGAIEGSGIGLALVKNYVELMGGTIDFESEEGTGSTFWVDLQTASIDEELYGNAHRADAEEAPQRLELPMKILYVEDNEVNRMLFENYIIVAGGDRVDFFQARNGIEGLEIARREIPDLIFLDINLPGMSGFDILEEIRDDEQLKDIRVIAVSANAMEGDAEKGMSAGFDAYMPKPFRFEQLQSILMQHEEEMRRRASGFVGS